jgi:hypothetical protein
MRDVKQVFTLAIPVEDIEWYETHTMLMNMSFDSSNGLNGLNGLNDSMNDSLNGTLNETLNGTLLDDENGSGARSVRSDELTLPPDIDRLFDGPAPAPTPAMRVPDLMTNLAVASDAPKAPERATTSKPVTKGSEG